MHDIRLIRENPQAFDEQLRRRGLPTASFWILDDDKNLRGVQTRQQERLSQRNEISRQIGRAKADKNEELAGQLLAQAEDLKRQMAEGDNIEATLKFRVRETLSALPNLPAEDVPEGEDESGNVELKRWGTPRTFDFTPQEHADFGPKLGLDFETAAKMSGARFTFLRGQMARLERALGAFMLDMQTGAGFTECATPLLVRDEAMFGTGQLPKFVEDQFFAADMSNRNKLFWDAMPDDIVEQLKLLGLGNFRQIIEGALSKADTAEQFWLVPTAEVSLTNSVRETILAEADLPIRLTALTPCFRSEAGAAGRDTRGYIRQHQFNKVELVAITTPDRSDAEHERMTLAAEAVLEALELPYRRMLLCAGDMGFSAKKTFDLEVWLPGQGAYREISSCSNCGDFQARRMDTRFRVAGEKGTTFVHTLNGSGLAVGRTLVAVLENYQQADGSVTVPTALLPYMGGVERLVPQQ